MKTRGCFKIIPQSKIKGSILIEKYAIFYNEQMATSCFYVDYEDVASLIKLLMDVKKDIPMVDSKQEEITYTKDEYLKQKELLIFEERYEEVIILDKLYKHFK